MSPGKSFEVIAMNESGRAFVTGSSGFIGRHLVESLLKGGWSVTALVNSRDLPERNRLTVIRGDICDFDLLKNSMEGTTCLFHLASALGASLIGEKEFFRINAEGTKAVLEAAVTAGVGRVVHFSSAGILGSVKKGVVAEEDYPAGPIEPYDRSKFEGEKIARAKAAAGMNVVVIRPGWVYGPGDRRTFKLIKAILKKHFIMVTKGDELQTPCFIDDLIHGTRLCAEKGKSGEIYNITGSEAIPVREICGAIAEAGGTEIPSFRLPLWTVRIAAWKMGVAFGLFKKEAPLTMGKLSFFVHPKPLSIDKARRELGYNPETDFRNGIARAIDWYNLNGWL